MIPQGSMPRDPRAAADDLLDNEAEGRLELPVEGRTVYALYERRPGILVVAYVYAPPPLRGTGAAGRLMEGVAARARTEGRRIAATCGYAHRWLRLHPRYRDLLA